jgi:hypothetical protein
VIGDRFEAPDEVRLVADAGPLGYLSIAAHGHADALALTMSVAGREILIDSGTFSYHTDRLWRDYFRGTSAHNTVRVDGCDQSVSGGTFLWTRHARATCGTFETDTVRDCLVASHDGYGRLPDPVMHRREIVYLKGEGVLEVTDQLECTSGHEVELFWHFAEDCQVVVSGNEAQVTSGPVRVHLTWSPELESDLAQGRLAPPSGWISRTFDVREPCPTLRLRSAINGSRKFGTRFRIETAAASGESEPGRPR